MKIISALLLSILASAALARDVYVKPHTRSDGTFVQGHYRTAPDNTNLNNYSTQGNVNPYTGQPGTVNPDSQPAQQWQPQQIQPLPQMNQQSNPAPTYNQLGGCNPNYPASCIR